MAVDEVDGGDHVECRDALGDAEDRPDTCDRRLHHRVRRTGGGDEDQGRVRAGLLDGLGHRVEDRDAAIKGRLAALARCHARDDVRAVGLAGPGVELTLAPGDALDDEPRVPADEDAHARRSTAPVASAAPGAPGAPPPVAPREEATAFAAASSREDAVWKWASSRRTAASAALVPTIRTTIGTSRVCCERASIRPRATSSPRVIPPK